MNDLHGCQLCPRLVAYRNLQKSRFPDYHCLPVAAFGDLDATLLIVGLAPGLHGANASGRPFSGDASGRVLFEVLHQYGFASRPDSRGGDDDLQLIDCRITNAVKCLPPQNRPSGEEIRHCNPYLRGEISQLQAGSVILSLGAIAHRSVLRALDLPQSRMRFQHLAELSLNDGTRLIDSYHCSRYNFNTGRLDRRMFEQVFERIVGLIR
ncbi:MAG: uracil-DNA glycosylase [Gammaproteobacteria bacterium]|nr:uracil-DNA glycosylase [Gammaproteobacteria bacterium]